MGEILTGYYAITINSATVSMEHIRLELSTANSSIHIISSTRPNDFTVSTQRPMMDCAVRFDIEYTECVLCVVMFANL